MGLMKGWDKRGWKDLYESTLSIKFDLNPMPLTPSSVAHEFSSFILRKNSIIHPTVQSI